MADNVRSIPSVVDGLKPGQRKVIYGCYLKKLKGEIKVSRSPPLDESSLFDSKHES